MIPRIQTGRYVWREEEMSLVQRVLDAADIYYEVTGDVPNLAHVNPEWFIDTDHLIVTYEGKEIRVVGDPRIQKKIVYIGMGVYE